MADFTQDHTSVRGAWEDTQQARDEYATRTSGKGATPAEHDSNARRQRIAEAAYRRAEMRGFASGFEEHDWLEAEKEIDATATEQHWGTGKCE
jgi:hypothetical protein